MTHTTTLWARIGAGLIGGLIGFALGPVLGAVLGAIVGGESGGPWPAEVGRYFGMGAGLLGGAFLGAFMVGRSVVARWCAGTAFAVGAVSFLAGFVGPILLLAIVVMWLPGTVFGVILGAILEAMKMRHSWLIGGCLGGLIVGGLMVGLLPLLDFVVAPL